MNPKRPVRPTGKPPKTGQRLEVLVVDDSAVVRQAWSGLLAKVGGFHVETACDPVVATEKIRKARPNVIVLDLEMPRMDGISFLRQLMADDPIPVVVCSSLAGPGTEASFLALAEGAVEVIAKPSLGVRDFLSDSAIQLVDSVISAAHSRPRLARLPKAEPPPNSGRGLLPTTSDHVIAIGASTGGTEALRQILEAVPPDAPGILVVQHMPEHFTRAFATRLNQLCAIEVREAEDGDRVLAGRCLIAPGNRHLRLHRCGGHYDVRVEDGPLVSRHRPSVDVLFESVAQAAGRSATAAILTGMGDDGVRGMLKMRAAGARTVAQDEATSVVFGMPKEAIAAGAAERVVPLGRMTRTLLDLARGIGA